jgi:ankyrin repeat protein
MSPNPRCWLTEKGFDPDGDLCEAMKSKSMPWAASTAMCEASYAGELGVCQWLFKHGAATTLRTKDSHGETPMYRACAKRHLQVAKWLYEVGAAEDIQTKDSHGCTPLLYASVYNRDSSILWLVLQGAANDETSGHVDAAILKRNIPTYKSLSRVALRKDLVALLNQHSVFLRLVLSATRSVQAESDVATPFVRSALRPKQPAAPQELSPLKLLCGHEATLVALIADFVGVVRGRRLRNAREAFGLLEQEQLSQDALLAAWNARESAVMSM